MRNKKLTKGRKRKKCPICKNSFITWKYDERTYCDWNCYKKGIRQKANTIRKNGRSYYKKECPVCNKDYLTREKKQKSCSYKCAGVRNSKRVSRENHHLWNGGKGKHINGYITRRISKNTYVLEHRLIMEQHLGRKLREKEAVHHVNGDKTDNRVENLEVMSLSEHASLHGKMR